MGDPSQSNFKGELGDEAGPSNFKSETVVSDHSSVGSDQPKEGNENVDQDEHDLQSNKRPKTGRARRACLPCRRRKCKCLGAPPRPCPNCIEDLYQCHWPTGDGRSSEARRQRNLNKRLSEIGPSASSISIPPNGNSISPQASSSFDPSAMAAAGPLAMFTASIANSTPFIPAPNVMNPAPVSFPPQMTSATSATPDFSTFFSFEDPLHNPFDALGTDFEWPSGMDSASLVYALSSRLPQIEGVSDTTSPISTKTAFADNGMSGNGNVNGNGSGNGYMGNIGGGLVKQPKTIKINWWRPHGKTAIAPGLKKVTLKVRVDSPGNSQLAGPNFGSTNQSSFQDLHTPDRMPSPGIMKHLLDIFMDKFGCQYPFLNRANMENDINNGTGSVFLMNCIAATAARFSNDPSLPLPNLKPHEYGDPFHKVAKEMMGSMLGVPSRETIMALVLLAHLGFAKDNESEEWMCTGMAVRMAVDLALHLDPEPNSISEEDRRLNRLLFWSVYFLDIAISFGVGRESTFRIESITQTLPSESDIWPGGKPIDHPTSPLPYTARQMLAYGSLVNILNGPRRSGTDWDGEVQAVLTKAVNDYNSMPIEMSWSVPNFQTQSRAKQGAIFLHIHLWMHHMIASRYLIGTDYMRLRGETTRSESMAGFGAHSGAMTPAAIADWNLWRNSARTIGDILVISDIIEPTAYLSQPFVNQAFFVAGCCYVREIETEQQRKSTNNGPPSNGSIHSPKGPNGAQKADLFRALFKSVASNNIATFQQGLAKQTTYWSGVEWVSEALKQRLAGIDASQIDLVSVTERITSSVTVPDAGVVRDHGKGKGRDQQGQIGLSGGDSLFDSMNVEIGTADFDLLSNLNLNFGDYPIDQALNLDEILNPQGGLMM